MDDRFSIQSPLPIFVNYVSPTVDSPPEDKRTTKGKSATGSISMTELGPMTKSIRLLLCDFFLIRPPSLGYIFHARFQAFCSVMKRPRTALVRHWGDKTNSRILLLNSAYMRPYYINFRCILGTTMEPRND